MNINKPVTNPDFVNVMREMKQGKKMDELFWKEIFKAKFLCPVNMEFGNTSQKENQKIVLGEGTFFDGIYRLDGIKKMETES